MLVSGGGRGGSRDRLGVLGFAPVASPLTLREAAWLERVRLARASGAVGVPARPSHHVGRGGRRAVEAARVSLSSALSGRLSREREEARGRRGSREGMLPVASGSPVDLLVRDFAARPVVPWHQTSTGRAGVLTTLVAGSGAPVIPGPVVGVDVLSRELFRWDAWSTFDLGMTRSPDVLISGLRGLGKSFLAKVMAVREIEYGRHVIVQSDRQGEWARVAGHVGGQVVAPGRGRVINPFELPGHRVAGGEQASWASEVMAARRKAVAAIAEALSPDGRPVLDKDMGTIVDAVVASFGAGPMTLTALVDRLADWEWVGGHHREFRGFEFQESLAKETASAAARVFAPLVSGGTMAGLFDTESSVRLDPLAPMIVFDTSDPVFENPQLKRVYLASISSWIDHLLMSRDGVRRIVVGEEAWDLLANAMIVDSLTVRQRSAGHWGCSTWLIVHGLRDLTDAWDRDSALGAKVRNLLDLTETKVTYRQGGDNMRVLERMVPDLSEDERAEIPGLPAGVGVWRVGREQPRLVRPLAGPGLRALFDTSELRRSS